MANRLKILVDADALVAIAKDTDSNHKKALVTSQKIRTATIYTTPFTIPEAVTVLSHKASQIEAKNFLKNARERMFSEIQLNPEFIQAADKVFLSQKTKGTSWIDCLNAAVVKTEELDGIFSFDKFYKKQGVRTFPSSSPSRRT